jgi:hypothetical protein
MDKAARARAAERHGHDPGDLDQPLAKLAHTPHSIARERYRRSAPAGPWGDRLSGRAFLSNGLHGDDASGAEGPDPRHRNVEVPISKPADAHKPSRDQHARAVTLEAVPARACRLR